jgi:PRELI-like family
MRLFSTEHTFSHEWESVTAANWKKYPNEITPHVIHVDYLSRHLDATKCQLHTERLLTCRQSVPALFLRLFGMDTVAYVYEKSVVDLNAKRLDLHTVNLTGSQLMRVEERCVYAPHPVMHRQTLFQQNVQMTTGAIWSTNLKEKLEDFCISRFQLNANRGRQALEHVLQCLNENIDTINQNIDAFSENIGTILNENIDSLNHNIDDMVDRVKHEALGTVEKLREELHEKSSFFTAHSQAHDKNK